MTNHTLTTLFKPSLLSIVLFSFCLLFSTSSAAKDNWLDAKPASFTVVEQLFLQANCQTNFVAAYMYDTETKRWWSHAEVESSYPEISETFATQKCDFKTDHSTLARDLALQWPEHDGPVILYFSPPVADNGKDDMSILFSPELKQRYLKRLAMLDAFDKLPKYKILTPMKGYRGTANN